MQPDPSFWQVIIQAKAVGVTVLWSGVVAFIAYKIADLTVGMRVSEEDEREGLDVATHGETAYNQRCTGIRGSRAADSRLP